MSRTAREEFEFSDAKYSRFEAWLDLISLANWEPKRWGTLEIKRGSFATSFDSLATRWKWSKWSVIRYLKALKKALRIRTVIAPGPHRNCTVIEVLNYESYQGVNETQEISLHNNRTQSTPLAAHKPYPTKEEELIIRNKNLLDIDNKKNTRSARTSTPKIQHLDFVFLTEAEYEKFAEQFGEEFLAAAIAKLDGWIGSNPIPKRKTNGKNAAACFRTWVFNAVNEDLERKKTKAIGFKPHTTATTTEHNLNYLRSVGHEPIDIADFFDRARNGQKTIELESGDGTDLVPGLKVR